MKITEKQVRDVATLANLDLSDDEVRRLNHDLDEVLTHVEALNELDTTGVEPMAQVLHQSSAMDPLRDDAPGPTLGMAVAVAQAPLTGAGYFKVPKVIER